MYVLTKKTSYLINTYISLTRGVCGTHVELSYLINVINVPKINHLDMTYCDYNVDVTTLK
jgi:hypothetical protein